jgi:hypothetical protein
LAQHQQALLAWIATQPWLTGAVILAAGLLSSFYGFRMSRLLLPAASAAGAWLAVTALSPQLAPVGLSSMTTAAAAAGLAGVAALAWPAFGDCIGGGVVCGVLGGYLLGQFGLKGSPILIGLALCGCAGAVMALVCRRGMPVLLTSAMGGGLMIVGFVGMAGTLLPSLSETFRRFARDWPLSMPVLLVMLIAMGYSCQANLRQGDIRGGATGIAAM